MFRYPLLKRHDVAVGPDQSGMMGRRIIDGQKRQCWVVEVAWQSCSDRRRLSFENRTQADGCWGQNMASYFDACRTLADERMLAGIMSRWHLPP
jgi:hypothetical protein